MTTPPADTLRAAAAKLRHDAEAARRTSPPPWAITDEHVIRCADGMIVADRSTTEHPAERADLPYICAMHPGVGRALADWLEAEAATWAGDEVHDRCIPKTCTLDAALATARALLGVPAPQDGPVASSAPRSAPDGVSDQAPRREPSDGRTDEGPICGSSPPDDEGREDCWCTLPPGHDGECVCGPCRERHGAPGWTTCANCGREVENRRIPVVFGPGPDNWVHVPGGYKPCYPERGADSPRAEPKTPN